MAALLARLVWIGATGEYTLVFDAADYDGLARGIAAGDGYPLQFSAAGYVETALRPAGYPYLLGATYALLGSDVVVARLLNALLGAATAAIVYMLCFRLAGRRAAWIGGIATAFYPPLVVMSGAVVSEPLFIAAIALAVLLVLRWRDRQDQPGSGMTQLIGAGAACGVATLARPNGLVVLGALVVLILTAGRLGMASRLRAGFILALAALLVATPWLVRNWQAFDRITLSTNAGFTVGGVYNAANDSEGEYRGIWRPPQTVPDFRDLYEDPTLNQAELDSAVFARSTAYGFDHPRYLVGASWLNLQRLFGLKAPRKVRDGWDAEIGASPGTGRLLQASAFLLYLLCVVALVGRWFRRRGSGSARERPAPWIWIVIALLAATTVPVLANPRYRVPIDMFVLVATAVAAAQVFSAGRSPPPR